MSTLQDSLQATNNQLREHFSRDRCRDYDSVTVLLLVWEDGDHPDFKAEAQELEHFFRDKFGFHVVRHEIPSRNSSNELQLELTRFLTTLLIQNKSSRNLTIIHYGGHGDPDSDDNRKLCVWAARSQGGPTLNWSEIQPLLAWACGDVLLLLDCCYAAQSARDRRRGIPANVEILAACAMGDQAAPPGPDSFTKAWMLEVEALLAQNKRILVAEVHTRLLRRERKLLATPVHIYGEDRNARSIWLAPLVDPGTHHSAALLSPQASLSLQMTLRSPMSDSLLSEILAWLMQYAPQEVSGIVVAELVNHAAHIQDFVRADASANIGRVRLGNLPAPSRKEVAQEWSTFVGNLSSASVTWAPTLQGSRLIVRYIHDKLANVQRAIERNLLHLLSTPPAQEAQLAGTASPEEDLERLGVGGVLKVHRRTISSEREDVTLDDAAIYKLDRSGPEPGLVPSDIHGLGRVLVEYKYFQGLDAALEQEIKKRIERLAAVLIEASRHEFRTPQCLGCVPDDSRWRYGLVFKSPVEDWRPPISLYSILEAHASKERNDPPLPMLEERFQLALQVGRALEKWHNAGWVHQSISSLNIYFFRARGVSKVDYSKPYLCGFDYTRKLGEFSTRRFQKEDAIHNIYRHPERQGPSPRFTHKKKHDLYSFGLVLLQIGLWRQIDNLVGAFIQDKDPTKGAANLPQYLVRKCKGLLGHEMGSNYECATMTCLTGEFGVERDDEGRSELGRQFNYRVLEQLQHILVPATLDLGGETNALS